MLEASSFDAVILNAQHNFAWLTGGGCSGVDLSRENGAASLMVTRNGRKFLLSNNIEMQRMLAEQVPAGQFEPIEYPWQTEKADGACALKMAGKVIGPGAVIVTDIPLFEGVAAVEGRIAGCRYRLTADERDRYRKLGNDAKLAVSRVIRTAEQGETEMEIAERLRHELARDQIASVVILVAADDRIGRFRHPSPTGCRWEKTLLLVICAKRSGLIASLSRMVSIGEPSDDLKRKTEAAAFVNAALCDSTRPGASSAELYRAAAAAYGAKGFTGEINGHHQGGAAGYRTRDWVAHPKGEDLVQMDQAFAWNPSITGTKVEETYIVGADTIEAITASSDVPSITDMVNGRQYDSPGITVL